MTGLGTILALNRLLSKGSGWVAGLWASWAFLAGGWPPLALIILLMPILVAVAGLRMVLSKVLVVIPIILELFLLVIYVADAPEAFHSSELVHFAPGPGVGTWLAFLFTIVAATFALSMPTKPPTQFV